MVSYSQSEKRQIIIDHYSNPQNKGNVLLCTHKTDLTSDTCSDNIHLELSIKDEKINDAKFEGNGCAIFVSSTDILLDAIKNLSIKDAIILIDSFENLILRKNKTSFLNEKLTIFENVIQNPNRVFCALLVVKALRKILQTI